MNIGSLVLLIIALTLLLMLIQRAEARRRLVVALFVLFGLELTRRYVSFNDLQSEGITALIIAAVLNLLFWALIGRYNPPGSSDDIKVLGLDD